MTNSECRRCGKTIYWHKSSKTGRNYPCDSPDNRRDFHQCDGAATAEPPKVEQPKPITPDYFEATLEQRVDALEKQLAQLCRTVQAVQARQPITAEDIAF